MTCFLSCYDAKNKKKAQRAQRKHKRIGEAVGFFFASNDLLVVVVP